MHLPRRLTGLLTTALVAAPLAAGVVPAHADSGVQPQPLFRAHSDHRALTPRLLATSLVPAQIRQAYAGIVTPAAGAGTTVASVQFSGWSQLAGTGSGDLVDYARANGLAVPAVTAVSVNGAPVAKPASPGEDFEVALDQEAVLAAAPGARQRVYVTTNDAAGGVMVWRRIADDLDAGVPISVVTTSWGNCEPDLGATQILAMEQQIARIAAHGVPIFAASGDNGSFDCAAGSPHAREASVDYPASSPHVLAVGGTTLRATDSGWAETAWGPGLLSASPVAGSGGGVSTIFRRPAWQAGVPGLPDRRLVPDLAAVADPQHGFAVYWTGGGGSPWWSAGGTSLGAPLQAGMVAATLAQQGVTEHAGDLHPALYAHPSGFRDVLTGTNGYFPADRGYDLATGLGSPQWSALAGYLTQQATPTALPADTTTPTGSAELSRSGPTLLRMTWAATDTGPDTGLGYAVVLERNGRPWLSTYATTSRSLAVQVPESGIYQLQVRVTDGAGNADAWRQSVALGPRSTCAAATAAGPPRCWAR